MGPLKKKKKSVHKVREKIKIPVRNGRKGDGSCPVLKLHHRVRNFRAGSVREGNTDLSMPSPMPT